MEGEWGGGGGGRSKLVLLLAPKVGLPDSVSLAPAGFSLLGQQASPQPLQARGEAHLHIHALAFPLCPSLAPLHTTLYSSNTAAEN